MAGDVSMLLQNDANHLLQSYHETSRKFQDFMTADRNLNVSAILSCLVDLAQMMDKFCLKDAQAHLDRQGTPQSDALGFPSQELDSVIQSISDNLARCQMIIEGRLRQGQETEQELNELTGHAELLVNHVSANLAILATKRDALARDLSTAQNKLVEEQNELRIAERDPAESGTGNFDIAHVLNINLNAAHGAQAQNLERTRGLVGNTQREIYEAQTAYNDVERSIQELQELLRRLHPTLEEMRQNKGTMISAIQDAEETKIGFSAIETPLRTLMVFLESCQAQQTRPTFVEMSTKLLSVVSPALSYRSHEAAVVGICKTIFSTITAAVDWEKEFSDHKDNSLQSEFDGIRGDLAKL